MRKICLSFVSSIFKREWEEPKHEGVFRYLVDIYLPIKWLNWSKGSNRSSISKPWDILLWTMLSRFSLISKWLFSMDTRWILVWFPCTFGASSPIKSGWFCSLPTRLHEQKPVGSHYPKHQEGLDYLFLNRPKCGIRSCSCLAPLFFLSIRQMSWTRLNNFFSWLLKFKHL